MWQVYPLGFAGVPVREPVNPAPRLGTAENWQSLVAACDERGIAVILDGVFSHVADVMRYWLDQGATGVASRRSLFCQLGILARGAPPSPHLPPPRLHFGEVIHGDYAQIVADTGMDSVTQYELWKTIWPSIKDENFFELDWCIKRHMEWVDSLYPTNIRRQSRRFPHCFCCWPRQSNHRSVHLVHTAWLPTAPRWRRRRTPRIPRRLSTPPSTSPSGL